MDPIKLFTTTLEASRRFSVSQLSAGGPNEDWTRRTAEMPRMHQKNAAPVRPERRDINLMFQIGGTTSGNAVILSTVAISLNAKLVAVKAPAGFSPNHSGGRVLSCEIVTHSTVSGQVEMFSVNLSEHRP